MKKERPKLVLGGHYIIVDGQEIEIDPGTHPDLCHIKQIWTELETGQQYETEKTG